MLNERQKKIVFLLKNEKEWKTGQELSNLLNVSGRTIRYDIERINKDGDRSIIESNLKYGYRLCKQAMMENRIVEEVNIPHTTEQRCLFIIKKLLFSTDKSGLFNLSEELCISQNTLEKELRELKRQIYPYESLRLVRRKNSICLEGKEQEKRKFYIDLMMDKWKNNILNLNRLDKEFGGTFLPLILEQMNRLCEKYSYKIRKEELPIFLISAATGLKRVIRSKYIKEEDIKEWKAAKAGIELEYAIANEFYGVMEQELGIRKYESEVLYLACLIAEKRYVSGDPDTQSQLLIKEILMEIKKNFSADLCDDEELKSRLGNFIVQMIVRKKKNIDVSDFYIGEIKGKYPKIFEMAVCAGRVIEEKEHIKIEEKDISSIAQYIGASLEKREVMNKYRVLMIYPMNQALSSLCVEKIEKVFRDRIYIAACHNFFERKKVLREKPDLILTTLPLQHDLEILTLQISIFVRTEDEGKIFQALNYLDEKRYQAAFQKNIENLIEKRLFFTDLNSNTPMEVIAFLCEKLVQAGYADETFQEEVIKREQMSPTSFAHSFAVPHPISLQSRESRIAVGILKKPIKWGDHSVKLVLMLAISEKGRQDLSSFFEWLGSTANDYQKISSLMKADSYETFIEKIND